MAALPLQTPPVEEHYNPRYYSIDKLPPRSRWWIDHKLKEFLAEYAIDSYPINSFKLAKKVMETGKIKLSIYATDRLSDRVDAVAQYFPDSNEYRIVVNRKKARSLKTSRDRRCNFTMAHELGHIFLEHLRIPLELKSKERKELEDLEADQFAAQLLVPEKLVVNSSFHSQEAVAAEFLVSNQCIWKCVNNLKRLDLFKSTPKPVCPVCGNADISPVAEYCVICGASFSDKQKKGVRVIAYHSPAMDNRQRTMCCADCDNEEFSHEADYCRICGLPLFNRCVGVNDWSGCGYANPLHARHCEVCGNQTNLSALGRLCEWTVERAGYIAAMARR